jgi:glycosyltransferase involved in cell wall biosynthesis
MIAVVIATYQREDGMTPYYLRRALESIEAQTYHDYMVYVIGDHYTNDRQFYELCWSYRNVKAYNLPIALERDKYPKGDYRLFCAGGTNACNEGIRHAMEDGCEYVCHLGHDDLWSANHLELMAKVIEEKNPLFICTLSTYIGQWLPFVEINNEVTEFYPVPKGIISSSTCVKYSETNLRVRDCVGLKEMKEYMKEDENPNHRTSYPSDADLWMRLAREMKDKDKKGYLIKTLTCHHDEQGYSLQA